MSWWRKLKAMLKKSKTTGRYSQGELLGPKTYTVTLKGYSEWNYNANKANGRERDWDLEWYFKHNAMIKTDSEVMIPTCNIKTVKFHSTDWYTKEAAFHEEGMKDWDGGTWVGAIFFIAIALAGVGLFGIFLWVTLFPT